MSENDLDFLEGLLGSRNLSTREEELIANSIDAYQGGFHKPEVVVWPEEPEQVSQILRYCNERRIPVYTRGGGTGLSGTTPIHGGVLISTVKMNRIIEVMDRDMQVRVQPGLIYERLNKELESHGLFFPPDPASASYCTIGGMVACNASGLKAVKYGTTRDYVLGFQAAFPDGSLRRVGFHTFKYSTGYDLVKMMVGSQGTLGVFTEITLRLRTLPEHAETIAAFFPSIRLATETIYHIVRRGLDVAALEFMDGWMTRAVSEFKGLGFPEAGAMILVESHGTRSAVRETLSRVRDIIREHGGFGIMEAEDEASRKRLWDARRGAYPATLRLAKTLVISDIIVPLSRLAEAVEKAYEIGDRHGVKVYCIGHFGDGNIHAHWCAEERGDEVLRKLHEANDEYSLYAISVGGAVSAEHGIGTEKKKFLRLQHPEAYDLLLKVKRMIDPNCILSPGIMFDVDEVIG